MPQYVQERCSTSKGKVNHEQYQVYPNPASDLINISIENMDDSEYIVSITDIYGKQIIVQKMERETVNITTDQMHQGFYILSIFRNNILEKTEKLIIQK